MVDVRGRLDLPAPLTARTCGFLDHGRTQLLFEPPLLDILTEGEAFSQGFVEDGVLTSNRHPASQGEVPESVETCLKFGHQSPKVCQA